MTTDINSMVRNDIERIFQIIQDHTFEQKVFLVVGCLGSNNDHFDELFRLEDQLDRILEGPDEIIELGSDISGENKRIVYFNIHNLSNDDGDILSISLKNAYESILKTDGFDLIIFIDENSFQRVKRICDDYLIPSTIFHVYHLGEIEEDVFKQWFRQQIPRHLSEKVIDIMVHGVGTNFSRAQELTDALYSKKGSRLFFVDEDRKKVYAAYFDAKSDLKLSSDEGISVKPAAKFFMFDTSAIYSPNLIPFLKFIVGGEWVYPSLVIREVHELEEKKKRSDDRDMIITMRNNLKFLNDNFSLVEHRFPQTRVRAEKTDNKLIDIAVETSSIVVTSDKQMMSSARSENIPVIYIP